MQALSQTVLQATKFQGISSDISRLNQFESAFARVAGVQHAVVLESPAAALRTALETAGVGEGDEVITSPYNSCAVAKAIVSLGARPAFVDIKEYSLNINSRLIAAAVSKRSKAILVPHTAGLPAEMPVIHQIAAMYGLRVIEDATYAFPAEYRGRMVGGESDFVFFGFAVPGRGCEEGTGVLCTNNVEWTERCRHSRGRVMAVASLSQLSEEESHWMRREEIARRYNHAFELLPELQIPADQFDCEHAWRLYMLRLNPERIRIDRDELISELKKRKVDAQVHFIPLNIHPLYRDQFGGRAGEFPVAYLQYLRELSLPIDASMTDSDVEHVIGAVTGLLQEYAV